MSDQSQETVYVFRPFIKKQGPVPQLERLARRLNEIHGLDDSDGRVSPALPRAHAYRSCSELIRGLETSCIEEATSKVASALINWVSRAMPEPLPLADPSKLPVAFVLGASPSKLTAELAKISNHVVTARPSECPTLRTFLKVLVNRLIEDDVKAMESANVNVDGRLTYDFGVVKSLLEFRSGDKSNTRIVITLEEADAFPPELLGSLIIHLATYVEDLPLYLVLYVRTPLSLFETRLPAHVAQCISSSVFVTGGRGATEEDKANSFIGQSVLTLAENGVALDPDLAAILYQEPSLQKQSNQLRYALLHQFAKRAENFETTAVGDANLHHSIFNPTYRAALEQTLTLAPGSLPLAIAYRIVHDAGAYVNLFEAYTAFKLLLLGDALTEAQNLQALAWFLALMAELKLMGIVRDCKRKFECVEKVIYMDIA